MTMEQPPVLSVLREGIGVITLNRPRVLNALSRELARRLRREIEELSANQALRVVVLRGAGRAFSAGADLTERLALTPEETAQHTDLIRAAADAIAALPVPVIAAIHGACLAGGAELALACDLRLASDDASFGFPEVKRGIFPGAGAVARLPRLVGPGQAADLIFTGRTIDAGEALAIGLVERLVPAAELGSTAAALADAIRANGPLAVRAAKAALRQGQGRPLPEALALAEALRRPLDQTRDYREGLAAFAERRPPRFTGK
ncbi:MAG TPA: enoyl-CoA hydratase-related protein [Thermomicrobiaceae bacterium]|nr:enoyl-CoA hydratase-related protein [Thermomicrobiaceae bacterium]